MRASPRLRSLLLAAASFALACCAGDPQVGTKPAEAKPLPTSRPKPPRPVRGESPGSLEGKRIESLEIRYVGPTTLDEARLRNYVSTKVGGLYASERVDSDIKSLYESGLIDDMRVLAEPAGNGLRVIYEVTTRGLIWHSGFVGNTAFSDERLAKESGLRVGCKPTPDALAGAQKKLEAYYRSHGYPQAKVELAWDRANFTFQIEEGSKTGS